MRPDSGRSPGKMTGLPSISMASMRLPSGAGSSSAPVRPRRSSAACIRRSSYCARSCRPPVLGLMTGFGDAASSVGVTAGGATAGGATAGDTAACAHSSVERSSTPTATPPQTENERGRTKRKGITQDKKGSGGCSGETRVEGRAPTPRAFRASVAETPKCPAAPRGRRPG